MAYIYESDVGRLGGNLQTTVAYLLSLHKAEYEWNLLGIKVVGHVDALPIPDGTYEYGDAYTVGTAAPYDMWIYTRADEFHAEAYWFNIGKFPAPGPQGPKGDGLEQINKWTNGTVSGVTYDTTDGAEVTQTTTIDYTDSTDGSTKHQQFNTTTTLPIVPGKYISMNATSDNKKMEVKVDDTELSLDYIKLDKTKGSAIPQNDQGVLNWLPSSISPTQYSLVQRDVNGDGSFHKLKVDQLATTSDEYVVPTQAITYGGFSDGFTVEKTPTDTGTLTAGVFGAITSYPNAGLKYDNQSYVRMDPTNSPDGTLNFIHLDSIEDGNGGHKATGKCFSITVSTRAWQVFDLDFGGSTRTTHNLTLTDSSTGTNIFFSLTNNRTETYEGAPAGLLAALENSQIACTVDANGTFSAGMITTDGTNFQVTYGNGEQALIDQMQVSITDNLV